MTDTAPRRVETAGPADPRDVAGPFSHRHTSDVRFADTDAMGHVNNAVFLTYCESARVAYWAAVTGEPIERRPGRAESLILADASIAFRAQIHHGERVTVETRVDRIGRTSLTMTHRLTAGSSDGPSRLVATCRTVIVRYDYVREVPTVIDDGLVGALEAFEGRRLREG
jgi:acyl-CoA thioester hydrolase